MYNPEDREYAIQLSRWVLEPLGIWPEKFSTWPRLLKIICIALSFFFAFFMVIPCGFYMFMIEKRFVGRLRIFGPLSFCLMSIYKYCDFLFNTKNVVKCLETMKKDYEDTQHFEQQEIMRKHAAFARKLIYLYIFFFHGSTAAYAGITPMTKEPMVIGNETFKFVAYPAYFVVIDPQESKIFFMFVYVIQLVSALSFCSVSCGICSIAIIGVEHICGQAEIIALTLKKLNSMQADTYDDKVLTSVVKRHLRILEFAYNLEKVLNISCLIEIMGCTFNMCMLTYYAITESIQGEYSGPATYILLCISFTFNIFIFCYVGNKLTEQCSEIGDYAYLVDWYKLGEKDAKDLKMIMMISERPIVLSCGKMMFLSRRLFANVVKASGTYLNMLLTVSGVK